MSVFVLGYGTIAKKDAKRKELKEFEKRGITTYDHLRPLLEPDKKGKVILIDVESEEYMIGDDRRETHEFASRKFAPHALFYCLIGVGSQHFRKE